MSEKILVVEDSGDAREFLQTLLEHEGFSVTLATDGVEGVEKAAKEDPDLIISDLNMPRMDGLQMIKRLRALPKYKDVPILAITSHGIELAMNGIRAGADRVLTRPVGNHLLISFVSDLLNKTRPLAHQIKPAR